jgi:hypothetical protein
LECNNLFMVSLWFGFAHHSVFDPALRPETQCRRKTSGSKEGSDPKGACRRVEPLLHILVHYFGVAHPQTQKGQGKGTCTKSYKLLLIKTLRNIKSDGFP